MIVPSGSMRTYWARRDNDPRLPVPAGAPVGHVMFEQAHDVGVGVDVGPVHEDRAAAKRVVVPVGDHAHGGCHERVAGVQERRDVVVAGHFHVTSGRT